MPSNENELKEFIGQKIGEATMQWEPIPSGVFKSEGAGKILQEIYEAIDTHTQAEVERAVKKAVEASVSAFTDTLKQKKGE